MATRASTSSNQRCAQHQRCEQQQRPQCSIPARPAPPAISRRRDMLLQGCGAVLVALAGGTSASPAAARAELPNKEVDAAESPYIRELLRRSEEKKEERTKERLNAYYKKVFKDYFEFEGGSASAGAARGIRPETQAAISQWLQDNQ